MVGQMKDAHETRERDLESRIHELKATVKDISQKNENLSSAYRMLKYDVETKRSHQAPQADQAEFYFPSDIELNMAQSREIAQLQSDLKELKYTNEGLKQKLSKKADEQRNDLQSLSAGQAKVEMGWGYLRKQLREFTLNTQQDLESERASLLTRCILAEEQQARLQHYIDTNLKSYQEEIVRLRGLLGKATPANGRR